MRLIVIYRSTDIVRTICTNLEKIFLAVSPTDNPEVKIHVGFISVSASRRMEKMARDVGGAELVRPSDEPEALRDFGICRSGREPGDSC